MNRYKLVIKPLTELTEQGYGGANGLISVFENVAIYIGLIVGGDVIDLLEILNKCFQVNNRIVAKLYKSAEYIIDGLNALETNEKFSSVFKECKSFLHKKSTKKNCWNK